MHHSLALSMQYIILNQFYHRFYKISVFSYVLMVAGMLGTILLVLADLFLSFVGNAHDFMKHGYK